MTTLVAFTVWTAPNYINYQGRMVDKTSGEPVDDTVGMVFEIWDQQSGGTMLWAEEHTAVVVSNGIYNVQLGSGITLTGIFDPDLFAGNNRWLQVYVNGELLTPRQQCTSVAYSFSAVDADTLDGMDSLEFAGSGHNHSFGEITGTATDGQIPNDITINNAATADYAATADSADYADSAGNADTVDGQHASDFAEDIHQHNGSDITSGTVADARIAASIARDGEVMGIVTANDGAGSGVDADMLDGLQGSSFLNTSNDYGRYGVTSYLYEGTTTLSNKYINDDSADTMEATTTLSLFSAIQNGTGRAIYAESAGAKGIEGTATGTNGAGVAGYCYATNGSGVFGQGSKRGVYGYSSSPDAYGVYGEATNTSGYGGFFTSTNDHHDLALGGTVGRINSDPSNGDSYLIISSNGDVQIRLDNDGGEEGVFSIKNSGGTTVFSVDEAGKATTKVLEILGGSDLSEQFDIRGLKEGSVPSPGMVVSIDPAKPGDLVISQEPYDKRVAGIISGAGGVQPGMLMGQEGSKANGANPVALTGRVYCWADAANGPIEPGDLLTTSDIPGHAMKVTDYTKAQGAVIGKAMSSLNKGKGLVLVLVSLH